MGVIDSTREVTVNIPAGIDDGNRLRLNGQGEPGPTGAPPGDMILTIHVAPSKEFRRQKYDVYSDMIIPFTTAALGGKVRVYTLYGEQVILVPEGTQPGSLFRLEGKGIPRLKGEGVGDHFVEFSVKVPRALTQPQIDALKTFEKLL